MPDSGLIQNLLQFGQRHQVHVVIRGPALADNLQVSVEQAAIADEIMSILMGDDVESRKHFITTNAKDVRFLDI